jgi:hypothetical protein
VARIAAVGQLLVETVTSMALDLALARAPGNAR